METLRQFEQADNFGSLIRPMLTDAGYVRGLLEGKNLGGDLFLFGVHERVLKVLKQAEFLAPRYHVVVANPPYMGGKGINSELKDFAEDYYPDTKSDMFAMFVERNIDFSIKGGFIGFMTPFTWMFLDSYEPLRKRILDELTLTSLIRPEYHAFFESAYVPICAYVLFTLPLKEFQGSFIDTSDFYGSEIQSVKALEAIKNPDCGWFHKSSTSEFKEIPGYPIAYWVSQKIRSLYKNSLIGDEFTGKIGVGTSNDDLFMRMFWEVSNNNIGRDKRWILIDKAGNFRKWYMGFSYVMDWEDDGHRIKNYRTPDGKLRSRPQNVQYLYLEGVSWGMVGSGITSFRWRPEGYGFNNAAPTLFGKDVKYTLGTLNSKVFRYLLSIKGATLNMTTGMIEGMPLLKGLSHQQSNIKEHTDIAILLEKQDWDNYELSSDFSVLPLIKDRGNSNSIHATYQNIKNEWKLTTSKMLQIENEMNSLFVDAYELRNEITPEIPLEEVTLTCNPFYRYGGKRSEEELEKLLLADTMKEFISYAVGCMFGRYSLDKPGLVLANQGETLKDYLKQVPKPTFTPDEDNVIPVLEGEWFEDDIAERFKKFLRVTFGEEHYDENLAFIEESIGRDVRNYFVKEFYKDHVQTYKKRPIYWMFSSPKGSFNALIYMHRYQPDTVSIVLNGYLREYIKKLSAHKSQLERTSVSGSASQSQKTKALKEITQVNKVLSELKEYEDDVLYPLATEQVRIDLDDGVKVNYGKFGEALSPIKGL